MNTRQINFIPFFRHIAWLAATAMVVLTGCREDEDNHTSPERPQKAVLANSSDNLRAIIRKELGSGNKRIVIPPGRYHLQALRGSHLEFSDLADVEVIAENVELVCTSTIRAVLFENCTNVTLRGLTIDYNPLPFTQGTIIAMAPDKSWIDFEIAQGYPDTGLGGSFQIYDPTSGTLRRSDWPWSGEIKPLGKLRHRVNKGQRYQFDPAKDTEQIGDILVAKSSTGTHGSSHAVELRNSRGIRLEDITLYASPSFGFLERGCHGTTYLRCVVDRRTPDDDPVKRDLPRMRSLNADAFHSKDAPVGPAILSCSARYMGDDAVNINGRFHFVRGSSGPEMRIVIIDRGAPLRPGDPVQFLPYNGPRPPDAKILQRRPDSEPLTEQEKTFIRSLRMDERMRASLLDDNAQFFILTLDRDIPLQLGSAIACSSRLGNGFSVKDCDFGETRSRGILIKASNGEISGNTITDTRMHAILVCPEFWWMEAGMASNLVIRGNTIKNCHETAIKIIALSADREIMPVGAHRNLTISNNRIENSAWPLIHVTSTTGLKIAGNILPSNPPSPTPDPPAKPILIEKSRE